MILFSFQNYAVLEKCAIRNTYTLSCVSHRKIYVHLRFRHFLVKMMYVTGPYFLLHFQKIYLFFQNEIPQLKNLLLSRAILLDRSSLTTLKRHIDTSNFNCQIHSEGKHVIMMKK